MDVLTRGQPFIIRCLLIKLPMGHIQFSTIVYICQRMFYYNYTSVMDLNKIKFCNIVKLLMGHVKKSFVLIFC